MALTVETGSGTNPAANSFISVANAKLWATARARPFKVGTIDATIEAFLINAMEYLAVREAEFKGIRVVDAQPLLYPRGEVYVNDVLQDSAVIPAALIGAQVQLALEQDTGIDLMPTVKGDAFITREVVGPIETSYSENINTDGQPVLTKVEAYLKPLLNVGSMGPLTTVRI